MDFDRYLIISSSSHGEHCGYFALLLLPLLLFLCFGVLPGLAVRHLEQE